MMAYSESTEDYLEAILRLGEGLPVVRQVDVAGFMGFSKASVFVNKEIDISLCRFSTLRWQAPTHLPS